MSYFLTNQKLKIGSLSDLSEEEARHILLSRRMKKGDVLNLQDKERFRYKVVITEAGKSSLKVLVEERVSVPAEPRLKTVLFQSFINEKALDFILQKSTEIGAEKIILFNSQNTAVKITPELFEKRKSRWGKILWEAAKQSDRQAPPEIIYLENTGLLSEELKKFEISLVLDKDGEKINAFNEPLKSVKTCSVVIGPEGGFTEDELRFLKTLPGIHAVSLGESTLRAETAALASLSVVLNY
ncbi:MAG: 16S rRNA (uracil(1498)-N(3))-methyltransferase [Candidatus Doudnabacteria bacterium]|nr:16S rRNA (uracil(1498)-N(3))-methyltransferase [Candidatus Doudnabacteria bacterium]